jgi:hypothetical protein
MEGTTWGCEGPEGAEAPYMDRWSFLLDSVIWYDDVFKGSSAAVQHHLSIAIGCLVKF